MRRACTLALLALWLPFGTAFSLSNKTRNSNRRRANGMNTHPVEDFCKRSCDDGNSVNCDATDADGEYTLGCDEQPTLSCDDASACASPPAPPGRPATAPRHPPPPPPPSEVPIVAVSVFVSLSIVLLAAVVVTCLFYRFGPGSRCGFGLLRWCWCCLLCTPQSADMLVIEKTQLRDADGGVPDLSRLWKE